jgi:hypothetical protein
VSYVVAKADGTNQVDVHDVTTADDFDRFLATRPCVLGPRGKCACCEREFVADRVCSARIAFAFALLTAPSPPPIVAASGCVGACRGFDCRRCVRDRVLAKARAAGVVVSA